MEDEKEKILAAEVIKEIESVRKKLSEGIDSKDILVLEEKITSSTKILEELSSYCQETVGPDKVIKMSLNIFLKENISLWKKKFWSIDIKGSSDNSIDIECSKVKLKKMFENLILNSLEAEATEIKINIGKKFISIEDNGEGISKQDAVQIKESGSTKGRGRGYGLRMVKSFASSLGWTIELQNNSNEGLTVLIHYS